MIEDAMKYIGEGVIVIYNHGVFFVIWGGYIEAGETIEGALQKIIKRIK